MPARQVREDQARYGEARVSLGYIVAILKCKLDTDGAAREPEVVNKFRVAVSDKDNIAAAETITHSNCADDITNRVISAVAKAIDAHQDSIDVGGAYFHGKPPDMEHGGRRVYVRVPGWLAALYPDKYPLRGPHGANFLLIQGNMPGRCDAGRIWQKRFDEFLHGYGLTQLLTDRRVWIKHAPEGKVILHDHVDDTRITATTDSVRVAFHEAWAAAFGEKIKVRPLSEDFTGLRHTPVGPRTVAISCGAVVNRLERLLQAHPLLPNEKCDWPLATVAFKTLSDLTTPSSPQEPAMLEPMQKLLGTIGFIAGHVRPDAYFAYSVLCRHASSAHLSSCAVRSIIRLGHYLVATRDLCLHITTPELEHHADGSTSLDLFDCYSDSSHGNGEHGASIGGFILASRGAVQGGGGAIAWRCGIQHEGDDSSAAAELRMATLAYKFTLAARFLLAELDVGVAPNRPTPFYLDAKAVIDGTSCERLAKKSRWMAMRYAMLRWGIMCGTIDPRKRPSASNPSDGLTKCLVGDPFIHARARLLGLPASSPPASSGDHPDA